MALHHHPGPALVGLHPGVSDPGGRGGLDRGSTLCAAFSMGSVSTSRTNLRLGGEPVGLEALIKLTGTIDFTGSADVSAVSAPVSPEIPNSPGDRLPNSASRAPESPSVPTPEEPMQVGGLISPEGTGIAGLREGDQKTGPASKHGNSGGRVQNPRGSLTRLQIPATICFQLQQLLLQALIDSRAEENFIDEQAAEQAGIPSEPLERPPQRPRSGHGRILAQVTHRTLPVKLVLSGNHVESIQLLVISSPATPLIIGYPWLATHNPHMDWAVGKVLSWSLYCHKHCLQSALSPTGEAPTPHSPLIESSGPVWGSPRLPLDLQEVFNKDKALSLPPHRPYDCAIELLPDAPLPSSRLYNLTRPEQEAMEGYINDSMAAGIIRPSTSPVGAGFFFVKKKTHPSGHV
ncbi:hypothetical protein L3Q82_026751 [Scortum barcoo]|uniref:Uncharacterized protein n=1 Tax=Scortum barcoo TaxID=214431 RepID=A0ACB8WJK9_9TELE|nr:hypothetical protein L3Q82_026751 [Scortum barcoo]